MKSLALIALAAPVLVAITSSEVVAKPGDPRVVQGVLAWSASVRGAPFVVVRGDDGAHYVADLSTAQRRGDPVNVGDRISLVGVEGNRNWEMTTLVIGSGDTALAALPAPPGQAAPAPAASAAPAAPAAAAAAPRAWRRIHGRIDSVADKTVRLRDTDGRNVTVDVSRLAGDARALVQPGDDATVFVVGEDDQRLVAVGFVQRDGSAGVSASPRSAR
jgi:hypothetical protein